MPNSMKGSPLTIDMGTGVPISMYIWAPGSLFLRRFGDEGSPSEGVPTFT